MASETERFLVTAMHAKLLALSVLILCSGCGKAEMSDARMNHLMAGDHGWIDLTIKSAPPPHAKPVTNDCSMAFSVNGETVLREGADFAAAEAKGSPLGYRFPVPSGQLDVELTYSLCVDKPLVIKQPLNLPKDQLVKISFSGDKLSVDGMNEYNPSSLESVRTQIEGVRNDAADTQHRLSKTNSLVVLCLVLNVVGLGLLLWKRRRA